LEDLLGERRLDVSYEMVRRWVLKFGANLAQTYCEAGRTIDLNEVTRPEILNPRRGERAVSCPGIFL
jgi:hypothetical protein